MLLIKSQDTSEGRTVELKGVVDEGADLERIGGPGSFSKLTVIARDVTRINSIGVKKWRTYFAGLREKNIHLKFKDLASCLVVQAAFISGFIRKEELESISVPFFCQTCGADRVKYYDVKSLMEMDRENLESQCEQCSKTMLFDEIPDEYFAILRD